MGAFMKLTWKNLFPRQEKDLTILQTVAISNQALLRPLSKLQMRYLAPLYQNGQHDRLDEDTSLVWEVDRS